MGFSLNPLTGQLDLTGSGSASNPTIGNPVNGADDNSVLIVDNSGNLADVPLADGELVIGNTGAAPTAASLTGTTNQLVVTNGAGSITLSLPQDIATTSSPSFANVGITPGGQLDTSAGGTLNVGATNAQTINIGNGSNTVNALTLNVVDKIVTLNSAGASSSGSSTGIAVKEGVNGLQGYVRTSSDRLSWSLKAPGSSGVVNVTPGSSGFNITQGSHDPITLGSVGSSPNSNGASLSSQVLTLQPADGTNPGLLSTTTQTIAGDKTFSGAISANNLSGTNTGNVSLAAVGAVPNANGASLSGQALTLQPANTSNPGVLTAADWNTFNNKQNAFSGLSTNSIIYATSATAVASSTSSALNWDNTNGRLAVNAAFGSTAALTATVQSGSDLALNIISKGSNNAAQIQNQSSYTLALVNSASSAAAGASIGGMFSRGTISSRTQSVSGDQLFSLSAQGYTGSVFGPGISGALAFIASENTTASTNGCDIVFSPTPNTTLIPVEALRIKNSGIVNIANLTASLPVQTDSSKNLVSAQINLTSAVTGILPVANGGTNSNSTLSNNRIMRSSGGAIVEATAITGNKALASDSNGIPVATTTTDTELGYVSGVTSAIQTQLNSKASVTSGDISLTTFSGLANNTSNQTITGLLFSSSISSFEILMNIFVDATADTYTTVKLLGTRKASSDWSVNAIQEEFSGDSVTGLSFNITSTGQVRATVGNIAGFSSAVVKFRAIVC